MNQGGQEPASIQPTDATADRSPADRIREGLAQLGMTEEDVTDAVQWARSNPVDLSEAWMPEELNRSKA